MTAPRSVRRLSVAGVVAAAALALTACAPASTDGVVTQTGDATADTSAAKSLDDIQESGELVIGTEGTYQPFTYHEGGSGALTGYDVDVATAVAEKLDLTPTFEETQFDALLAGLDAGRFDIVANQISITDEREAGFDFSTPYTVSRGAVITAADNTDITSLADLEGKTTAQSQSSNFYTTAKDAGADVQVVEGWAQSVALLEQGRIDATVNDELTFLDYVKTNPDKAAAIKIAATTDDVSNSALVTTKGSDDLVAAIDDALAELKADGTLAEISDQYFGQDVSE
ncbi:transporter substrate-binding domain-containing protein [Frigoribacterium sp. CFBP9030]|nr:transporter substrate-binding domain-containing protein [Frigoribacterium sp. CFBP9030]MBD8703404.1 transporter substrate-binding domain-containing protein [Frigoribacterium sp. CFBP 13712]MDY0891089.1 transporter substrate-binding domain-containing protein [Frigoribacterium sp. CFBP9030]